MNTNQRLRGESFQRVLDNLSENPLATPIAAVTALTTQLTATADAFESKAELQYSGRGTAAGGVVDKRVLKAALCDTLADLAETAKVLDPEVHPGIAEVMKVGNAKSYMAWLTQARAFHAALVPAKADFVAYGSPTTVDADLLALIESLEAALERKNSGKTMHIDGTASLAALCKTGVQIVRKLDAILSKVYKNDPGKLAAWKAARRCEKAPRPATTASAPQTPPPAGSGS